VSGERDPWVHDAVGGIAPWLREELATTAREVAAEWRVRVGDPYAFARYSYVARADDDKVLKIVPTQDDEGDHEADALALWNGDGAVRLLRHDRERRALLIERAFPGEGAEHLPEEEGLAVATDVAPRLWKRVAPGRPFRSITEHVPQWLERAGTHPLVAMAEGVYASLTVHDTWVVHGDFHHHNLLRHGDRWLAIDPKPYAGEREFDVATLLWNPVGHFVTRDELERRIAAFVAIGLDERRIRAWAIVRGTYLGLPLSPSETERTSRQLRVVHLLG
jgi:streptomycin 6-kinase